MTAEERLREEIGRAQDEGLAVKLWWRDDDLSSNTANFDTLLEFSEAIQAPVLMTIIPGLVSELQVGSASRELVYFCQHGWRHANHEAEGIDKSEFGPNRDPYVVAAEIARGLERLDRLLGARRLPVFVPPWNAFDDCHLRSLLTQGFTGLSKFKSRNASFAAPGLRLANSHIDVLTWRPGERAQLRPADEVLDQLATLVALRTKARADPEPIGLLTHHRVMLPETWPMLQQLFRTVDAIPGVSWAFPPDVFKAPAISAA